HPHVADPPGRAPALSRGDSTHRPESGRDRRTGRPDSRRDASPSGAPGPPLVRRAPWALARKLVNWYTAGPSGPLDGREGSGLVPAAGRRRTQVTRRRP